MIDKIDYWKFYGRKREIATLESWMTVGGFDTFAVVGARGVGKTTILRQVEVQLQGKKPFFYIDLPVVNDEMESETRMGRVLHLCFDLAKQVSDLGLTEEITTILGSSDSLTLPSIRPSYYYKSSESGHSSVISPFRFLMRAYGALLKFGAVVVLDEFQNAVDMGIVGDIRRIVDEISAATSNASDGKAVFVGSNQQGMLEIMYSPTSELFNKISGRLRITPMQGPDLLEMASSRGWLNYPARFLTVYTAIGGNVRFWRRFSTALTHGELTEPPNGSDKRWKEKFIEWRVDELVTEFGQLYYQNPWMWLSQDLEDVLSYLGANPNGVPWSEFIDIFKTPDLPTDHARSRALAAYRVLMQHLGFVETVGLHGRESGGAVQRVRITEHEMAFQLTIMSKFLVEGLFWANPTPDEAFEVLGQGERFAMQRLTKECLEEATGIDRVFRSVEYAVPNGKNIEVDVAAEPTDDTSASEQKIVLCACRRDYQDHNPIEAMEHFDRFLEVRRAEGKAHKDQKVIRYLVAPYWGENKIESPDFKCIDFAEMANSREHNLTPLPLPLLDEPDLTTDISLGLTDPLMKLTDLHQTLPSQTIKLAGNKVRQS